MVGDIGAARAVSRTGTLAVEGGPGLNVTNSWTVRGLAELVSRLVVSPELRARDIGSLTGRLSNGPGHPAVDVLVQGNVEVMVSENCVVGTVLGCDAGDCGPGGESAAFFGLRDSKRRVFPLSVDGECRTHLRNSVDLCLLDHVVMIAGMGVDGMVIDARWKGPAYAREVTALYREALDLCTSTDGPTTEDLERLKEGVRRRALGGITTGPFLC